MITVDFIYRQNGNHHHTISLLLPLPSERAHHARHWAFPIHINSVLFWLNENHFIHLRSLRSCSLPTLSHSTLRFSFQVGWLRAADQTVLALQDRVVTHNARISVSHENYLTWRLRIKQLRETDKGCYMCQINSSPMKKQIGCIDVQSKSVLNCFFFTASLCVSLSSSPTSRFCFVGSFRT